MGYSEYSVKNDSNTRLNSALKALRANRSPSEAQKKERVLIEEELKARKGGAKKGRGDTVENQISKVLKIQDSKAEQELAAQSAEEEEWLDAKIDKSGQTAPSERVETSGETPLNQQIEALLRKGLKNLTRKEKNKVISLREDLRKKERAEQDPTYQQLQTEVSKKENYQGDRKASLGVYLELSKRWGKLNDLQRKRLEIAEDGNIGDMLEDMSSEGENTAPKDMLMPLHLADKLHSLWEENSVVVQKLRGTAVGQVNLSIGFLKPALDSLVKEGKLTRNQDTPYKDVHGVPRATYQVHDWDAFKDQNISLDPIEGLPFKAASDAPRLEAPAPIPEVAMPAPKRQAPKKIGTGRKRRNEPSYRERSKERLSQLSSRREKIENMAPLKTLKEQGAFNEEEREGSSLDPEKIVEGYTQAAISLIPGEKVLGLAGQAGKLFKTLGKKAKAKTIKRLESDAPTGKSFDELPQATEGATGRGTSLTPPDANPLNLPKGRSKVKIPLKPKNDLAKGGRVKTGGTGFLRRG